MFLLGLKVLILSVMLFTIDVPIVCVYVVVIEFVHLSGTGYGIILQLQVYFLVWLNPVQLSETSGLQGISCSLQKLT